MCVFFPNHNQKALERYDRHDVSRNRNRTEVCCPFLCSNLMWNIIRHSNLAAFIVVNGLQFCPPYSREKKKSCMCCHFFKWSNGVYFSDFQLACTLIDGAFLRVRKNGEAVNLFIRILIIKSKGTHSWYMNLIKLNTNIQKLICYSQNLKLMLSFFYFFCRETNQSMLRNLLQSLNQLFQRFSA